METTAFYNIGYFQNIKDARIDKYVLNSDRTSIYHLTAWCELIKNVFDHDTYYVYAESINSDVIGVLPLVHLKSRLFGNYMVSMPYFNYGGAVANSLNIESSMINRAIGLATELGAGHIEFRDTASRKLVWPTRKDKVNMILDLPDSVDIFGEAIGSKRRSQIKRPIKEGVKSFVGGIELLDGFYHVFSAKMRDLGTPVYGKKFFLEILKVFPAQSRIIVLKLNNKPISAAFLIGFKEQLEIPWASTVTGYNKFSPNMLLYWEVLKYAIESGYQRFDFGRSTIDSGTYRFKKQWGATPKQLYWHYWLADGQKMPKLTPGNARYKLAIKAWQYLPVAITKWLGPGIIKNLP